MEYIQLGKELYRKRNINKARSAIMPIIIIVIIKTQYIFLLLGLNSRKRANSGINAPITMVKIANKGM